MICQLHDEGSHGEAMSQVLSTKDLVSLASHQLTNACWMEWKAEAGGTDL